MTKAHKKPKEFFGFVRKAFTFQNGALMPFSIVPAFIFKDILNKDVKPKINVMQEIRVMEILISIFNEEIVRGLLLTFIVFLSGLGMYIFIFVFDFITGMKASRKQHNDALAEQMLLKVTPSAGIPTSYIRSDKLWSSVWKLFAVITITAILTVFSSVFVLLEQSWLHQGGMLILLFFYITVISFDVHSIGENQERRFGKKPAFYSGMDDFFKMIGDLLMLRIKKIFSGGNNH